MNLYRSLRRTAAASGSPERSAGALPLSFDQWASYFSFNGLGYGGGTAGSLTQPGEKIDGNFAGIVEGAYKRNGIIFACVLTRMLLFSEARFQFRRLRDGRPGELFGNRDLRILEKPWKGGTTGGLLTRAIQDVDMAGNFYAARRNQSIRRLRPDWVTIITGSRTGSEYDTELVGYSYQPGGPGSGEDPIALLPEHVAHFAPIPDPMARYRGMSWITPVIDEILGDAAATTHKKMFFENGATPNLVVVMDPKVKRDAFLQWVDAMEESHAGMLNAYKTLYLAGGADAKVIGADMKQIDFKVVQGAGETRIAAAAGVPPVIVGLSEGLEAATYSNYGQARRRLADGTIRPLWRDFCGSMATIIDVPNDAELWYDDRDIPFLQEDMKDEAEIQNTQSQAIRQLVDAGFEPETVVAAVTAGDLTQLKHSGLYSVQLQKAGESQPPPQNDDVGLGSRPRCIALTKKGEQCTNSAAAGSSYCGSHQT